MKRIISVCIHLFCKKGKQGYLYAVLVPIFIFLNLHYSLAQDWIRSRAPFLEQHSLPFLSILDSSRLEFFPLKIGNVWQWRNTHGSTKIYQWEIKYDTIISGKKYYKGKGAVPGSNSTGLIRIDSLLREQMYFYGPCGESKDEFNFYRLGETQGTIYEVCHDIVGAMIGIPRLVKFNGIFRSNVFGEPRDVMEFLYGGMRGKDTVFSFNFYLVRGIGIYSETYEIDNYQCTGAIIDGKVYGALVHLMNGESIPEKPILSQNYPNPSQSETQINFTITKLSNVTLKLYNIHGKEIKTILSETKDKGNYNLIFNTRDLQNGIYIYQLSSIVGTDIYTLTKKMIIVR